MADAPKTGQKQDRKPGTFVKGQTGNPKGRPRKTEAVREVEAMAKALGPQAIDRLAFWMKSKDSRASIAAANSIIERGYGKARQQIDATITDERMVVRAPDQPADAADWVGKHGPH